MSKCIIVGGADIGCYQRILNYTDEHDFWIYCDSGLKHLETFEALTGRGPDLVVGDFDSHENPHLPVETIVLPREKDDTDTVFAVKEGLRRGFESFLLVGVIGARFDHSLGNIQILLMLDSLGKKGLILDDYSEMEIVSRGPAFVGNAFPYFSLLNISGLAKDITIRHAKYEINGAEITCDYPYGVSNEPLPGETAKIEVGQGRLLLIKDFA